ncbi:MAG: alanine--tRNA ligase [Parcubacteria group bacterium]|nr:alanine--tRNA ligase [Parcubacteria group bacterium]
MKADKLRKKYLKFFEKKGHKIMPSASLIPQNDPTVLFTTAGMHPLVPYLLGEKHPLGVRLVDSQKCIRTQDIDEVGDATHGTFFEMLGNWSLGDYFKKQAIEWSFEFLTKELKIKKENLAISVFEGEGEIPRDEESAEIWKSLGIPKERIVYLGKDDNWWGPAGKTGPCGPDTEMFYWTGEGSAPEEFDANNELWVEIWNDVFMQYNKTADGKFKPLSQKNVDTGMGFERVVAILQGKDNIFATELYTTILKKIGEISGKKYEDNQKAFRIIADHLKASVFMLAEKLTPSNIERGYILRRLIRRSIRYGKILGINENFTSIVGESVIEIYKKVYPEVEENKQLILDELRKEEQAFSKTLERGLREFNKMSEDGISSKEAFDLYQSYGFPIEMTKELAKEKGIDIDEQGFYEELKKHQDISRTATEGKFKAGLADDSEQTIKYHTATHLLHTALRQVLGDEVQQMGSNITGERIRFDFSFERKMTPDEIEKVENIVNEKIEQGLQVKVKEMPIKDALDEGALAFFRDKYPEKVKVYTISDEKTGEVFSKEICSGPHCDTIINMGHFKIIKEESSSSGVRRIKAILE